MESSEGPGRTRRDGGRSRVAPTRPSATRRSAVSRGEALDFDAGTITVRQTVMVLDHEITFGMPRPRPDGEPSAYSPAVPSLRTHRKVELEGRMAWGPA